MIPHLERETDIATHSSSFLSTEPQKRQPVHWNIVLSNDRPVESIRLYTKILYTLSPDHVCAFLNRRIAYVHEGYSELAVIY